MMVLGDTIYFVVVIIIGENVSNACIFEFRLKYDVFVLVCILFLFIK